MFVGIREKSENKGPSKSERFNSATTNLVRYFLPYVILYVIRVLSRAPDVSNFPRSHTQSIRAFASTLLPSAILLILARP
jgi:hypothetical protein